jgi:hypothetical protein
VDVFQVLVRATDDSLGQGFVFQGQFSSFVRAIKRFFTEPSGIP